VVDNNFASAIAKIETWKQYMLSCNKIAEEANQKIKKLVPVSNIFKLAGKIIDAAEKFLQPIAKEVEKFANSVGPVLKNLMSCCPCGRPNPLGCIVKTVSNAVNLVSCPLNGITSHWINGLMDTFKMNVGLFIKETLPELNIRITIPAAGFQIDIPTFLQECFSNSRIHKKITKLCGMPSKSLTITFGALFKSGRSPTFEHSSSLDGEVKQSCARALGAFKTFGQKMSTCFDSIEDVFFVIPVVGFLAALTCDPNYSDPDPGINYCPCKAANELVTQKEQKQPYCVIWDKSAFRNCPSLCREKNYISGKNPSGGTGSMHKTFGYPSCDKLKYYCREVNIKVRHGQVKCSNPYTFLGGACKVIPDKGYICPVNFIECGAEDVTKGVCWNYRFIECSKDDKKHFPMCTCHNRNTFQKNDVVCQSGSTKTNTLVSLKEMRKSFACFKPYGLEEDVRKDCGKYMYPCMIQRPNVEAYHRCNLDGSEKFWDAHGKKFVIAGGVLTALFLVLLVASGIGLCMSSDKCHILPYFIFSLILLMVAIAILACGLTIIKSPEDDDSNYLKMGEVP
jgi:hypothetical protein